MDIADLLILIFVSLAYAGALVLASREKIWGTIAANFIMMGTLLSVYIS